MIVLDKNITSPEERKKLVEQIIAETPQEKLTPHLLEYLANYLIYNFTKEDKQSHLFNTPNRMVTINRNETSYEGLCGKLDNGEDGVYNLLSDLGKGEFITRKIDKISTEDIDTIPELKELREAIETTEAAYEKASGHRKRLLKKQIIEMRQDQYIIRNALKGKSWTKSANNTIAKSLTAANLYDKIHFDAFDNPVNDGPISFFNPRHIEALLCNYSALKENAYGNFENELYFLMEDLDNLVDKTLKTAYPLLYDLLILKIDKKTNIEIQKELYQKHGIHHSIEYISSLWRNKIPKLIAEQAQKDYLLWYYTYKERGEWKKCTRCGQIKLAHNKFFSRNSCSKDGWYSLCKDCRNIKKDESGQS